jgi:formate hydrogenlyase subunit 3/multisubunit Na+/H+ antiporter MnhD subunit
MDIYHALLLGIALLVASAIVTPFFAAQRRLAGGLNFLACTAAGTVFAGIAFQVLSGAAPGEGFVLDLRGFTIPFLIDGFSALFLALISFMGALVAFYCIGYMEMDHYRHYSLRSFCASYPVFLAGMVGIVSVDDLSTGFSIAWQMMTIASFFLIRFDRKDPHIIRSANKYLALMELAWLFILIASLLIPGSSLGTPLHELAAGLGVAGGGERIAIYGLLLLGFGMKTGVFPLGQLWLPDAHASAPSPISALLSGVMIKTGVYGLVRTLFWMVPPEVPALEARTLGLCVACFGVVTLFIGTVQALKQNDAKRLLAYSSIGQMGYILLGIGSAQYFMLSGSPLLTTLSVVALVGAIYHLLNHALFKGLLFLSTGSVQYATGTKDLDQLGGLLRLMPVTALVAAVASASIAGLPAFSGFMSKWAIIAGSVLGGKSAGVIVIFGIVALMTSAITLALTVKFFGMIFTSSGVEWGEKKHVREVGGLMLVPMLVLAAICLIQGFFPWLSVSLLLNVFAGAEGSIAQSLFADPATQAVLAQSWSGLRIDLSQQGGGSAAAVGMPLVLLGILVLAVLFAAWLRKSGGSQTRSAPVWLCGYQTHNADNSYVSSHIYAAFKKFMKWTGGNVRRA